MTRLTHCSRSRTIEHSSSTVVLLLPAATDTANTATSTSQASEAVHFGWHPHRTPSMMILLGLLLACIFSAVIGFRVTPPVRSSQQLKSAIFALDDSSLAKLDEMKARFDRLSAVDSEDAEVEREKLRDIVEKYTTFKEVKLLMIKLRNMWKGEASDRRKSRILKNFIDLYKGRLEIEEILKKKLGLSSSNEVKIDGLEEILQLDAEIDGLQKKLKEVEMMLPTGMSTVEERFGKV